MPDNNSYKPRLREITEGALGNITAAVILALLGVAAGGVTIGWFPTLLILLLVSGSLFTWYKLDPSFQRLLHQRLFKIRHAISSESVVLSRWNLIVEETISTIIRQNSLSNNYLQVERRRAISFMGRDHLELVLDYQAGTFKWLVLVDGNGTIIDQYGGFQAVAGECDNCGSTVLTRYGQGKAGKVIAEPQTTCRRCKKQTSRRVINLDQYANFDVRLQKINNVNVQFEKGKVCVHIEYIAKNFSQTTQVRPKPYLKIARLKDGKYVLYTTQNILPPFEIPGYSEITKKFTWTLSSDSIVLTKEIDFIKIDFEPF